MTTRSVVTRQQTGGNPAAQASQASRQLQANLNAEGRHVTEFLLTVDQTISPLQQVQSMQYAASKCSTGGRHNSRASAAEMCGRMRCLLRLRVALMAHVT